MLSKKDVRAVIRALIEEKLGTPIACSGFVRPGKENNYSLLETYSRKKGIYLFIGPEEVTLEKVMKEVPLYVGASGNGAQQRLKERVTQNFTPGDTGGTFRKNLATTQFGGDQKAAADWILRHASVQLVETPDDEHGDLEKLAIEVFEPKYNIR